MRNRTASTRPIAVLAVALIAAGFLLRSQLFVDNRSFWLDEALLARNIVNRSAVELFAPLDDAQGAPVGFLLAQKGMITLFGARDFVLRLIPFVAATIALPLMYAVGRRYINDVAALVALGLFAFADRLLYYATEMKQYGVDVLLSLLLLLLVANYLDRRPRAAVWLAVGGTLAPWFSHAALFVMAGAGLVLAGAAIGRRDRREVLRLIGIGSLWIANFAVIYLLSLRNMVANPWLTGFWSHRFAPLPPWSNAAWYVDAFLRLIDGLAGAPATALSVGVLLVGLAALLRQDWRRAAILIVPLLCTLIAAALQYYPFGGRLLLFGAPLVQMALGAGVAWLFGVVGRYSRPAAVVSFVLLAGYLLSAAVPQALANVKAPPQGEAIKPLLEILSAEWEPDDRLYLYYGALPAFDFYAAHYGLDDATVQYGIYARETPQDYLNDVDHLRGSARVWILFSHECESCPVDEQQIIVDHLDAVGNRLAIHTAPGAALLLYDLRQVVDDQ